MNNAVTQSLLHLNNPVTTDTPILHFSHANGYAPLTYSRFLEPFQSSYKIIASNHRPLWTPTPDPEAIESWEQFGFDIVSSLSSIDCSVTSVGHSMGCAATVIAASQQPELFRRLVLVEPALVPPSYYFVLKLLGKHIAQRVPLVNRTLKRVDSWASPDEVFAHFRPKSIFKNISDDGLWDYVSHGTYADSDGRSRLVYSKEWEARCYILAHNIWPMLKALKMPVLIIRGENSNTFSAASFKRLQSLAPQYSYLEVKDAGHLLPFEHPERLARDISSWLASRS